MIVLSGVFPYTVGTSVPALSTYEGRKSSLKNNFSLTELSVMYTALQERIERLKKIPSPDIKLTGEIGFSEKALEKVKSLYLSAGRSANDLH